MTNIIISDKTSGSVVFPLFLLGHVIIFPLFPSWARDPFREGTGRGEGRNRKRGRKEQEEGALLNHLTI